MVFDIYKFSVLLRVSKNLLVWPHAHLALFALLSSSVPPPCLRARRCATNCLFDWLGDYQMVLTNIANRGGHVGPAALSKY